MKTDAELMTSWKIFLMLMVTVFLTLMPTMAVAYDSPMGYVICSAALMFSGNAGRGLATVGISVLGVGALLGKVSWGIAIVVGVGIALIFSAPGVILAVSGVNAAC